MRKKWFGIVGDHHVSVESYPIGKMSIEARLVYDWIAHNVQPVGGHVSEATITNMMMYYYVMEGLELDPGYTIYKYMFQRGNAPSKMFPYGSLITAMMEKHGIVPKGRSEPMEFYDKGRLDLKQVEFDRATLRFEVKKPDEAPGKAGRRAVSIRVGKQAKKEEEFVWMSKITRFMGCLTTQVEQAKKEVHQTRADQLDLMAKSSLTLVLSDGEEEPEFCSSFVDEPVSLNQLNGDSTNAAGGRNLTMWACHR